MATNVRRRLLDKIVTHWENQGRVLVTENEYKLSKHKPVDFLTIRKYIGSYNRVIRWAYTVYPERMEALNKGRPLSETPQKPVQVEIVEEPVVEEPVVETTESDSTSLPHFWAESVEEPKDE